MSNLERILNKLRQLEQQMSLVELLSQASEALEATLDQKLLKAGSLEGVAGQLEEVIQLLFVRCPDCPVNDLRYRLAHLYMRAGCWKEADEQLIELSDYEVEVGIYGVLCQLGSDMEVVVRLKSCLAPHCSHG